MPRTGNTRRRLVVLSALAVVFTVLAVPLAFAAEDGAEGEETTTTTFAAGEGPAIVVPPPEAADVDLPWTDRFLIPTLVVTAFLVVGGVTIYYFTRVKNRYRIVEG